MLVPVHLRFHSTKVSLPKEQLLDAMRPCHAVKGHFDNTYLGETFGCNANANVAKICRDYGF